MKPIDLSGLIKGLMIVIGIAMAMGKLDHLKKWAAREIMKPAPLIAVSSRQHAAFGSKNHRKNY